MMAAWPTAGARRDRPPMFAPSRAGDADFYERMARYQRQAASPSAMRRLMMVNDQIDVRPSCRRSAGRHWCCSGAATSSSAAATAATWPTTYRMRCTWNAGRGPPPCRRRHGGHRRCRRPLRRRPLRARGRGTGPALPGHGAVHRHRRLHRAGRRLGDRAWRDLLQRFHGLCRAQIASLPRPRDRHRRRRLLRHLRRAGAGHALRRRHGARPEGRRHPDPRRAAHRRGRKHGRQGRRHGGAHRRAGHGPGRRRRGLGVEHRPRPGGRLGHRVRGPAAPCA